MKYVFIRWFSTPQDFIKWYLSKNNGSVKLKDGTWAVNQSEDFHLYCYNEAYQTYISKINKT